jgi:hypothetical protein
MSILGPVRHEALAQSTPTVKPAAPAGDENTSANKADAGTKPDTAKPDDKPKLTPEQERGLRLLKKAEAEAAGLPPDMRAMVLWQVSQGYWQSDRTKAIKLLEDAFRSAKEISDTNEDVKCFTFPDQCHAKPWLEQETLMQLLGSDNMEQLLPRAEPAVRRFVTNPLIMKYVRDKNFDRAEELLMRAAEEPDFPYEAATQLMLALPETRAQHDRLAIFNQAVSNYRTFGERSEFGLIAVDDLATLIVRFWQHLPPQTVLEAIDLVLDHAREVPAEKRDHVSAHSPAGDVSLDAYDYRLP